MPDLLDQPLVPTIAGAVLLIAELVAIAYVVAYKEHSTSALAWSFAILLLPALGLILLVLFGRDRLPRRLAGKADHTEAFRLRLPDESAADAAEDVYEGWGGVSQVARACGASPMRAGNLVTFLATGEAAFRAVRSAIAEARHHVHVEEYIFRNDKLGGELLALLIEKAKAGVEVRLLVDAIGTTGERGLFRELRRAGGTGAIFLPLNPFRRVFAPNHRNHRKIIVCDGRVGFLGGMNVGDEYFGLGLGARHWSDAHLQLEGPSVHDLQRVFVRDWDFAAGEEIAGEAYFPIAEPRGTAHVQVVASGPDELVNSTRQVLFTAINGAERRLVVSSPYLVPDMALRDAIRNAALRGVDVSLLTQGRPPENWLTYLCSRFYWEDWLRAGVRIFEYQRGILHAKAMVADSRWATIGSANLDNRSLDLNFEIQGLIEDPETVAVIAAHFDGELADAREVTLDEYLARPFAMRVLESVVRLGAPLL